MVIFAFLFIPLSILGQSDEQDLLDDLVLGFDGKTISLEKNLSYYHFKASNEYLVWYEGHTEKLLYQDLSNDEIGEVSYKKGRGPFEIQSLRMMTLLDNELLILDSRNSKLIKYDLEKGRFVDEFVIDTKNLSFITSSKDNVYGKAQNQKGLYFKLNIKEKDLELMKVDYGEEFIREAFKNPFRFDGPFLANEEYLISVRLYEPSLTIYSKSDGSLEEIWFDDTKIEPAYEENEFGFVSYPPDKLSLRIHDAALKPNSNTILFAMEGESDNLSQISRSVLYQYDLEKGEYDRMINTEASAIDGIMINDDYIFVYDENSFEISRIEY
jgi:hypothetical protein